MDGKLFNLDWQKYLALLFLLLGAGFFSSGVVIWQIGITFRNFRNYMQPSFG